MKSVEVGTFPQVRRAFQVTRCNQCADAPCVAACPTEAMYRRPDGIVDFDKRDLHRLQGVHRRLPVRRDLHQPRGQLGREVQPVRAPAGGRPGASLRHGLPDGGDPGRRPERSRRPRVSEIVSREPVTVRRPEKGTRPGLFYKGAAPGDAGPAGRAPAGRRPVRLGDPGRRARRRVTCRRASRPAQLERRGAAVLRRGPPRAVGLAGQPLHLDQGHRRRRPARPAAPDPRRQAVLGEARWPAGRRPAWRWPSSA